MCGQIVGETHAGCVAIYGATFDSALSASHAVDLPFVALATAVVPSIPPRPIGAPGLRIFADSLQTHDVDKVPIA